MRLFILGDRPHIFMARGYWRVTPWNRDRRMLDLWNKAHVFVGQLNNARRWIK